MPTRKFRELVQAMPPERQQRIANRVQQSLAAMPLEEIRKARQMTQAKLAETLGGNQGGTWRMKHGTKIKIGSWAENWRSALFALIARCGSHSSKNCHRNRATRPRSERDRFL